MCNKCALNALLVGPGWMRKGKCDNRNEEKGKKNSPDPLWDRYNRRLWRIGLSVCEHSSTVGHRGDCSAERDSVQRRLHCRDNDTLQLQQSNNPKLYLNDTIIRLTLFHHTSVTLHYTTPHLCPFAENHNTSHVYKIRS